MSWIHKCLVHYKILNQNFYIMQYKLILVNSKSKLLQMIVLLILSLIKSTNFDIKIRTHHFNKTKDWRRDASDMTSHNRLKPFQRLHCYFPVTAFSQDVSANETLKIVDTDVHNVYQNWQSEIYIFYIYIIAVWILQLVCING